MKKLLSAAILVLFIAATPLKAQNLKDVLNEYFDVTGQKKILKVETLTTIGKINQGGLEIPFKQITARPSNFRVEGTFQGLTFLQTFNGTEAWTVNPFSGSTEPQPIPADQLKSLKIQADMDGMLWDWKDKGYTAVLDSTEDVEGTKCFKVDVTTDSNDVYTFYIDTESYLLIKSHAKVFMSGQAVESDTYYSNYKDVDGMILPGQIENRYNGVTGELIIIDRYEVDTPYNQSDFNKPVAAETPVTPGDK